MEIRAVGVGVGEAGLQEVQLTAIPVALEEADLWARAVEFQMEEMDQTEAAARAASVEEITGPEDMEVRLRFGRKLQMEFPRDQVGAEVVPETVTMISLNLAATGAFTAEVAVGQVATLVLGVQALKVLLLFHILTLLPPPPPSPPPPAAVASPSPGPPPPTAAPQ